MSPRQQNHDWEDRLLCEWEASLLLFYRDLTGQIFHPKSSHRKTETSDGWFYIVGPLELPQCAPVKVGSCANPRERITQFNCPSYLQYHGFFWRVSDCAFWEKTVLNIFDKYRVERTAFKSEVIIAKDAMNGLPDIVDTWGPDPESVALLWHSVDAISFLSEQDLYLIALNAMLAERGFWSVRAVELCLELYDRRRWLEAKSELRFDDPELSSVIRDRDWIDVYDLCVTQA